MLRTVQSALSRPTLLPVGTGRKLIKSHSLSGSAPQFNAAETNPAGAPYFRTRESNVLNHDERHLGRIFELDSETVSVLGCDDDRKPNTLVSKDFLYQLEAFQEYCFLLRKPMLETANYIRQLEGRFAAAAANKEPGVPNTRFLIWGEDGCGKTTTLMYATSFCHLSGFIVCNFYTMRNWYVDYKEMQESEWNPSRIDHVTRSQTFLGEFLVYNKAKIGHLTTHQTYEWSQREKTEKGSPLLDVITKGIERPKFAGDSVGVLLKELRLHCQDSANMGNQNHCKVAIVVDGAGVLFDEKTFINRKFPQNEMPGLLTSQQIEESVAPDELSIVSNVKKMLRADYPNSLVLATADIQDKLYVKPYFYPIGRRKDLKPEVQPYYPFALLGQDGWELLDPFVPVEVGRYTKSEMDLMIDYYLDRKYIRDVSGTDAGRAEIYFLTGRHPGDLMEYSKWW